MADWQYGIIRELAKEYMEIASLPKQEETRRLWRLLNAKKPERPMVSIDQICWSEMDIDGALDTKCEDARLKNLEYRLRMTIYKWKHFPADMVVEPYLESHMAINNFYGLGEQDMGFEVKQEVAKLDPANEIESHKYINQLKTEEDLEAIKPAVISLNRERTESELSFLNEALDGIIPVRLAGVRPNMRVWDIVSTLGGVENMMYEIADRPEFVHALIGKMTDAHLDLLDQMEEKGLLASFQTDIHCTGAYTDELPAKGFNEAKPRAKDLWTFGLAQLFSCVSSDTYAEFDFAHSNKWYERFGLVYYGCCDPLDKKMASVRKVPNLRKVSMSPWTNSDLGASEIAGDFVFSSKPNPAMLAGPTWEPEAVKKELGAIYGSCRKYGCPLEFILKDISTVKYRPKSLFEWEKIAMRTVCE